MVSVELSTPADDRQVVAVLRGELDVTEAASVAASLGVVADTGRDVIVDLAGLEYIDSSGLAALVLARQQARRAGRDLLLVAPQQQVLRMLAATRLLDVFAVHARIDEAVGIAGSVPAPSVPEADSTPLPATTTQTARDVLAAGNAA